jgi:hypothetical protein
MSNRVALSAQESTLTAEVTANGEVRPHPDVVRTLRVCHHPGLLALPDAQVTGHKRSRSTRTNTTPSINTRPTITTSPTSARLASRVPECLQQNLKIAEENILEAKDANPAQFVDTSIVEKINASGFIKTLWERIIRSPLLRSRNRRESATSTLGNLRQRPLTSAPAGKLSSDAAHLFGTVSAPVRHFPLHIGPRIGPQMSQNRRDSGHLTT